MSAQRDSTCQLPPRCRQGSWGLRGKLPFRQYQDLLGALVGSDVQSKWDPVLSFSLLPSSSVLFNGPLCSRSRASWWEIQSQMKLGPTLWTVKGQVILKGQIEWRCQSQSSVRRQARQAQPAGALCGVVVSKGRWGIQTPEGSACESALLSGA